MKVGLQISSFDFPGGDRAIGPTFAGLVRAADEGGFASLWVMDHFFQIEYIGPAEEPMLEGYAALSFAAGITSRISLGTMVTGVTYRHPGLLVKTATTLDVLSGGRAYLGIGAAWFEREHLGLGVPYPPLKERFERLEETLRIARQMWTDDTTPFAGVHYQLAEPMNHPQALAKPRPPILIGGGGEQKTLRLVAQYGDACNLFSNLDLPSKLDVLKGHCETVGRDYAEIEKTTLTPAPIALDGTGQQTPADVLAELRRQAELGIDHVILSLPKLSDPKLVELAAREIVAPAREIAVAGR
ncbi:MAG: LLM class F420-dependent oxidoreductase [Thermomicrobiales bacterium]|nr:LLM class F420-dependent oxidoreductase [Thermomicrobiales bacterium]